MSARMKAILIVVAVIVVAYPATAWLIGIEVEAQLQRDEQQLWGDNAYLRLVQRDYHRGVYGATEVLTFSLGAPFNRLLSARAGGQALPALRLTVRNAIHHGPLPRLRTVALATVDSQLQLPPQLLGQVQALLAGKPIVQGHTILAWVGANKTVLTSPALQYRAPDGTGVSSRGITLTLIGDHALKAWSMRLAAPAFSLQSSKGRLELTGLSASASMHRVFDALNIGTTQLSVQQAEFRPATGTAVRLQGISFKAASSLEAQYVSETAQLEANAVQAAQFSATRLGYVMSVEHLYAPSLVALTQSLRPAQRGAAATAVWRAAMLQTVRQYGGEMMLHDPVLKILRLGFFMPAGELRLSANLTAPGLTLAELQGSAGRIAQHLAVSADLRVDQALVDKLLSGTSQMPLLALQLQQLESQGYLKHDGNALSAHLVLAAGQIRINGQPYPPRATATPP